jgi:hypothetical protein
MADFKVRWLSPDYNSSDIATVGHAAEFPRRLFNLIIKTLSEIKRWPSTYRNNPVRFAVSSREISITGEAHEEDSHHPGCADRHRDPGICPVLLHL